MRESTAKWQLGRLSQLARIVGDDYVSRALAGIIFDAFWPVLLFLLLGIPSSYRPLAHLLPAIVREAQSRGQLTLGIGSHGARDRYEWAPMGTRVEG